MLTPGQIERRRKGLGGTDAAAILGHNPYSSPLDVYLEKRGLVEPSSEISEAAFWGSVLEPAIAKVYAEKAEVELEALPEDTLPRAHPDRPWQLGTPDRLIVGRRAGLEIKTAGARQLPFWGESGTDRVPRHYLIQCLWYANLFDAEEWILAALLGGQDFRVYRIGRNEKAEAVILERAERFWVDHVLAEEPPGPSRPSDMAAVAALLDTTTEEVVMATPEQCDLVTSIQWLGLQIRGLEEERDVKRAELGMSMKDVAAIGLPDDRFVRWVQPKAENRRPYLKVPPAKEDP